MWDPQTWELVQGKTGCTAWVRSGTLQKWERPRRRTCPHSRISSGSLSLDRDPGSQWGKGPLWGREKEKQKSSLGEQLQDPKKCHGVIVPQVPTGTAAMSSHSMCARHCSISRRGLGSPGKAKSFPWDWALPRLVECLPCRCEVLSLSPALYGIGRVGGTGL